MHNLDPLAASALQNALEQCEPRLMEELARYGASSPDELPTDIAAEIFQQVLLETAAKNFPDAQIEALRHGLNAFRHPRFWTAFNRLKARTKTSSNAFESVSGIDAAIVLAGLGLPVAPFDRKRPRILAEPSSNIETVAKSFSRWKTAYVGYSPCDIPFYIILTDCMRTLREQVFNQPQLKEVKALFQRSGFDPPTGSFPAFKHGLVLIAREHGDAISSVLFENLAPDKGSIVLYAGWRVDSLREGTATEDGFLPVPAQFLNASIQNPETAMWIWRPIGGRVILN